MKPTRKICTFYSIKIGVLLCFLLLLICSLLVGCSPKSVTIPVLLSDGGDTVSLSLWDVEAGTLSQPEELYSPVEDRFPLYWDGGSKYIFETLPTKKTGQVMSVTSSKYFDAGTLLTGNLRLTDTGESYVYSNENGETRTYPYPTFAAEYPLLSVASLEDYPVFLYAPTDGVLRYADYDPALLDYTYHEIALPSDVSGQLQFDRPYLVGNLLYLTCGNSLVCYNLSEASVFVESLESYGITAAVVLAGGYGDILILKSESSYFAIQNRTLLGSLSVSTQIDTETGHQYLYSELCFPWQSVK